MSGGAAVPVVAGAVAAAAALLALAVSQVRQHRAEEERHDEQHVIAHAVRNGCEVAPGARVLTQRPAAVERLVRRGALVADGSGGYVLTPSRERL